MNDQMPAYLRTFAPLIVAWLGTLLAKRGMEIDSTLLEALVGVGIGALYYTLVRQAEKHKAWLGWLLLMAKQPAYSTEPAPSPGPDESVEAVVVPDEGAWQPDGILGLVVVVVAVVLAVLYILEHT